MSTNDGSTSLLTHSVLPLSPSSPNANGLSDEEGKKLQPSLKALDLHDEPGSESKPESKTVTPHFRPLIHMIKRTFADDAPSFVTRAEHNAHYRTIWSDLRIKVAADASIPESPFNPPKEHIEVLVSHWPVFEGYCCPCDLPEDEEGSNADIEKSIGGNATITKDLFLKTLGDAFYGEKFTVGTEEDRPIIDHFEYIVWSGKSADEVTGPVYAMTRGFTGPVWSDDSDTGSNGE